MYKNDKVIRRYSESFKLKILEEFTIEKLYGINPTTIKRWIINYIKKVNCSLSGFHYHCLLRGKDIGCILNSHLQ